MTELQIDYKKNDPNVEFQLIEFKLQSDGTAKIITEGSLRHFEGVAYCGEMNAAAHSLVLYTKKEYENFIFAIDQLEIMPNSMASFCKKIFPIWDDKHQTVSISSQLIQYLGFFSELCMLEFADNSKYLCSRESADMVYQFVRGLKDNGRL